MSFRVAIIQLTTSDTVSDNIDVCRQMIRQAVADGADLVATPECTHLMELNREAALAKARVESDDEGLRAFQALAAELSVWLSIGSLVIKLTKDRLVNRQYLISPKGRIHARYDKLHLFDVRLSGGEAYRESALYEAGDKALVSRTPLAVFGHSICYDVRFPGLYRDLAQAGANVLLVPAAFTKKTGKAHWHSLLKTRAIENGAYVIAAAQTGQHATGRSTFGHSLVINPWGDVLLDAGQKTGVYFADIDLTLVQKVRQALPSLQHDRDYEMVQT